MTLWLALPKIQLGAGAGNSWVSPRSVRLEMGTQFSVICHTGWLNGCPNRGAGGGVGTVGCHAQQPERCPGLVMVVHPGEVALLAAA